MVRERKPNCAMMHQQARKEKIEAIKKIVRSLGSKVTNKEIYLMIASKFGLSHRKASEYVRIAKYQLVN